MYWYGKNIQGDIVAVYSSTGTVLMNYTYTAWEKTEISYYHSGASTTAVKNNLTYRGYYYDSDLGMYYLQSRYYDPNTCRFINADVYAVYLKENYYQDSNRTAGGLYVELQAHYLAYLIGDSHALDGAYMGEASLKEDWTAYFAELLGFWIKLD